MLVRQIGQHITTNTPRGPITGRIVGTEQHEVSCHGGGNPETFLCVAPEARGAWIWLTAAAVAEIPDTSGDETDA